MYITVKTTDNTTDTGDVTPEPPILQAICSCISLLYSPGVLKPREP